IEHRLDDVLARRARGTQPLERLPDLPVVAGVTELREALALALLGCVVDAEHVDVGVLATLGERVDADQNALAALDLALLPLGRERDLALEVSHLDAADDPAEALDFLEDLLRLALE